MARQNLLIIGSGLTAAVTCSLISKEPKLCDKLDVQLWEKARGSGGRMSTSRSSRDPECTADLGAQFVTVSSENARKHSRFYDELVQSGVLEPLASDLEGMKSFPADTRQYVAPNGSGSIVKKFLRDAEANPHFASKFGAHVSRLVIDEDKKWHVSTLGGTDATFDGVISTMPVPQILQLEGDVKSIFGEKGLLSRLENVKYSSRYALGMFFDRSARLPATSWSGKFIYDHPIWRYASWDHVKRNRASAAPALVLHTSIQYGAEHVESTTDQMQPALSQAARELFPDLPEPAYIKCQKWRFSQVVQSYPESKGCVVASEHPLLLLAGDGFAHSHVDGCFESALSAFDYLLDRFC